ncbi:MAG: site-specific integrase [Bdellovibrionales bacterium]|nr:site-specific integrase [Bdellovibrionales bacterium]
MGIKFDELTKTYSVSFSKRKPGVNQMPVSLRRVGISTEREAKQVFNELVVEVQRRIETSVVPTWQTTVEQMLAFDLERGISKKTLSNIEIVLRGHTFESWGSILVNRITGPDILKLLAEKVGHTGQANQQYFLKCVRQTFQFAANQGYVPSNPTPQKKFRVGDKIKKVLTRDQVRQFLNLARELNHQWYPHWAFALYTGMRNGELFALTWGKVDLDRNQILIDTAWNNKDGFKSTKSGDDRRLDIAPGLLPVIRELKLQSMGCDFVLPRVSRWEEGDQARELRMFLSGMGLPPVRFHDLRATWATLLLSQGLEPIKVMKMGGWKDMKTMMIYVRKAGIDIAGAMAGFSLHEPVSKVATVLEFGKT